MPSQDQPSSDEEKRIVRRTDEEFIITPETGAKNPRDKDDTGELDVNVTSNPDVEAADAGPGNDQGVRGGRGQ